MNFLKENLWLVGILAFMALGNEYVAKPYKRKKSYRRKRKKYRR